MVPSPLVPRALPSRRGVAALPRARGGASYRGPPTDELDEHARQLNLATPLQMARARRLAFDAATAYGSLAWAVIGGARMRHWARSPKQRSCGSTSRSSTCAGGGTARVTLKLLHRAACGVTRAPHRPCPPGVGHRQRTRPRRRPPPLRPPRGWRCRMRAAALEQPSRVRPRRGRRRGHSRGCARVSSSLGLWPSCRRCLPVATLRVAITTNHTTTNTNTIADAITTTTTTRSKTPHLGAMSHGRPADNWIT